MVSRWNVVITWIFAADKIDTDTDTGIYHLVDMNTLILLV